MKKNLIDIFSGLSLGALVGVILGLSISEVAGVVLGGLISLLATFLGLKKDAGPEAYDSKHLVTGFSVGCLLFILIGIRLRTHDMLSPSIDDTVHELQKLNVDPATIQRILVLKKYGVDVRDAAAKGKEETANHPPDLHATVLYAAAEDHVPETHTVAQRFSMLSLEQLKTYLSQQGLLYDQFNNNVSQIKDTGLQKDLLIQLIVICYDYKKQ